jgi:hypothetical protein
MLQVGFQPTIPAFERAKTVLASDRAAAMIGPIRNYGPIFYLRRFVCFIAENIIICIISKPRGGMEISRDQYHQIGAEFIS